MSEQQFGRYSLLRRLSQDAFGSVYRAGVVAGGGVAELVLLRTFDIPSSELEAVEQRLRSGPAGDGTPSLPNALDKGVVDGTPFLVYRYASGRTVRDLMQETAKRGTNVPVEHGLFLMHRVCRAAEAYARASKSSGVVFPETLYLSNDGDIQILARELAGEPITALAKSMGLSSYLAPEVRDANVQVNDDVFAMAALLREMLGDSAPDDVRALVDDGTATAADRMALDLWQGKLEQLLYERPEQSSAFNVAFFLNGLLINEIEEDARRIEAEKTALGNAEEEQAKERAPQSEPQPESKKKATATTATAATRSTSAGMPKPVLLAAGLVALALLGFLGWSMFRADDAATGDQVADQAINEEVSPQPTAKLGAGEVDSDAAAGPAEASAEPTQNEASASAGPRTQPQSNLASPPANAIPRAGNPGNGSDQSVRLQAPTRYTGGSVTTDQADTNLPEPPPTDAELQAQIDELARQKTADLEEQMRQDYEQQMQELQERLDEAEEERKRQEAEELARKQAEEEAARKAAEEETQRKAEEERLAQAAAEKAAEEAAKAKPGDLVNEGPGVTTAAMTKRPSPVFPRMAQRMGRSATVTVRVLVDHTGKVEQAELSGDKAGFGFDEAALAAARETEWKAAVKDGVNVKVWKSLRIVFDPNG